MKLEVNSIIEDVATNEKFRILQISHNVVDLISMENQYKLPERIQVGELEEYFTNEIYKVCEEEDRSYDLRGLTDKQKRI